MNIDELIAAARRPWPQTPDSEMRIVAAKLADEVERLRGNTIQILKEEIARLRRALEDIKQHQDEIGGELSTLSTTRMIAEKALRGKG